MPGYIIILTPAGGFKCLDITIALTSAEGLACLDTDYVNTGSRRVRVGYNVTIIRVSEAAAGWWHAYIIIIA